MLPIKCIVILQLFVACTRNRYWNNIHAGARNPNLVRLFARLLVYAVCICNFALSYVYAVQISEVDLMNDCVSVPNWS